LSYWFVRVVFGAYLAFGARDFHGTLGLSVADWAVGTG